MILLSSLVALADLGSELPAPAVSDFGGRDLKIGVVCLWFEILVAVDEILGGVGDLMHALPVGGLYGVVLGWSVISGD